MQPCILYCNRLDSKIVLTNTELTCYFKRRLCPYIPYRKLKASSLQEPQFGTRSLCLLLMLKVCLVPCASWGRVFTVKNQTFHLHSTYWVACLQFLHWCCKWSPQWPWGEKAQDSESQLMQSTTGSDFQVCLLLSHAIPTAGCETPTPMWHP